MDKCQNILFYTSHPQDQLSRQILNELQKNNALNRQFVKICISNPNLKLPRSLQHEKFPLIVTKGIPKPVSGGDALTWIQEGAFSGKAGQNSDGQNMDFGDLKEGTQISEAFGMISDENKTTNYHQQFNDQYNTGIDNEQRVVSNHFSNVNDMPQMDIFAESDRGKSKKQMDQRFNQFQQLRTNDTGRPNNNSYISRNEAMANGPNMITGTMGGSMPGGMRDGMGGGMPPGMRDGMGGGMGMGAPGGNMPMRGMPPMGGSHMGGGGGSPPLPPALQPIKTQPEKSSSGMMPQGFPQMGGGMNQHPSQFSQRQQSPLDNRNIVSHSNNTPAHANDLPSGFPSGTIGGGVNIASAHSGQSLLGKSMDDSQFNTRKRDHQLHSGMPSGMGGRPPLNSGMNTSW